MSLDDTLGVGFYGKIPALGDFVSRRLPRAFIEPWDQWLQAALLSSREILGEDWLSAYLVSPIWRFALSSGVCDTAAWAGVMMPSVDKVGRYFPLTLAQNIDTQSLCSVFLAESDWFEQLENLALSALSETFDFETFDQAALSIQMHQHLAPLRFEPQAPGKFEPATSAKQVCRFDMENLVQIESLFPTLSQNLIGKLYSSYSFWAGTDSRCNQSRFLCCQGMPPIDAYAGFLQGLPQYSGWNLQVFKVNDSASRASDQSRLQDIQGKERQMPERKVEKSWVSHGLTVVGNKRKHNEDAMLNSPESGIWVVADGMGGHHSGDVASRLIVESLATIGTADSVETLTQAVCANLNKINAELCQFASGLEQGSVVGSTVVVLLAKGSQCSVIWAGDSRLYRFRQGKLNQITRDHTLLDEIMDTGHLTREEALQHSGANIITRAVGGHPELQLDVIRFLAETGDRYLLCSDGLDKELSEEEISRHMTEADCESISENLINHALNKNGRDNITALVTEFHSG